METNKQTVNEELNTEEVLQEVIIEENEDKPKKGMFKKKQTDEKLLEEIETLKRENAELKNQYYKAYADADNYKKRVQKELENSLKYRIQSFASEILPVIDNLERALQQETTDEQMKQGVQMIYDQLIVSLKEEGVIEIEALNQPFDYNVHQALMTEKVEGIEPNKVLEVLQKGYKIKDRILRPAFVKVSE